MSAWPSTSTNCWRWTYRVLTWCAASTSPACTLVMRWGALIDWKIERTILTGARSIDLLTARKEALSLAVHSHSRFCRKANDDGKVSVLRVVSIWNTLRPLAAISRPIRQLDECRAERV